ncbi:hypothetical protein [Phenylobacterium sp.]|uniref:hypothetical protein n=1 Tax=Phenylobacterium sp. TaxID=1871053 RepID=UPI0025F30281|nr:hypothetical protein [Phenylobacterium sp.]MCA3586091.1 hypothetical protein [Methylocystis sp.]MCA6346411.1 hypothetical protein [Phenylobacterium sp.]MCA6355395.1 hypothetical protein [Phenylobacterium sp.]MCA6358256.1 hypothetical protein [Phenylobacterium sp.]MCA6361385.1 hypothetical protein [Phenylobacterium sp.]
MSDCYLDHIGSALGARRPITALAPAIAPDVLADLCAEGLQSYCEAGISAAELATAALEESLERAQLSPDDLDLIIYGSVDALAEEPGFVELWGSLRAAYRVPVMAVGFGNCSNLSHGIRLGRALLAQEDLRRVAVVVSDRVATDPARLGPFDGAILSDGAASVLLSAREASGWRVLATRHSMDHGVRVYWHAGELTRTVVQTARRVRDLVSTCLEDAGLAVEDMDAVVGVNMRPSRVKALLQTSGLDATKLRNPTLAANSHVFAADALLNLSALEDTDADARHVLMLNLGPSNWGATIVQRL